MEVNGETSNDEKPQTEITRLRVDIIAATMNVYDVVKLYNSSSLTLQLSDIRFFSSHSLKKFKWKMSGHFLYFKWIFPIFFHFDEWFKSKIYGYQHNECLYMARARFLDQL